ncbi:striatin-interacting proteins 2 [Exaiptasia diaphana]|uniref:Striatin-interacting protein 1 homolog n=1 Tax=Exaiptasia diaphana TaxID=2652724 RepID=A0A913XFV5_EXADI|nr:striatin-interacting proteins 2 [Exaiptasia diaphana]KXJ12237.1 Striatin-interacting protein 1 [Exaiptasia diaphana]
MDDDRRQRGIPKLRDILRRQRRESEGQIDTPDIEFDYGDSDKLSAEISELYSYTEECEFQINRDTFEFDYYQTVAEKWVDSSTKVQQSYVCKILDRVESADLDTRTNSARILLYLVQGNFAEVTTEEDQISWSNKNVVMIYQLEGFNIITQLLQMEADNTQAADMALHKPSISMADSCNLRIYINILYTMIERMRVPHNTDTEEIQEIKNTFKQELNQPIIDKDPLAVILFEMVLKFCAGNNPHFPIKKVLLILWKTVLTSLGGLEHLESLKRQKRIDCGLPPSYNEQCPPMPVLPAQQRVIIPQTPPPVLIDNESSDSSEGSKEDKFKEDVWPRPTPKVRLMDVDNFLDNTRSKFVGFQLHSDRSTIAGLPQPIHEGLHVLKKHLYTSLSEMQIKEEEELEDRPFTKSKKKLPSNPTEQLYQAMLPNLPQYMIALLKILLAAAPTAKAKTESINILADVLPEDMPSTVLHSMRLGIDVNRHKEIIVKAISGLLFILLKHLKLNHIYQFEFMAQHLVFANCIPLILKILNQNILAFITAKNTIPQLDFPVSVLGPPSELTAESLESADMESCCWRNLFSCINLVRILQKLTKWKHSRTMMLVVFKSAPILKRALKAKHDMLQLYVLKLLKAQTKYLGRNWRKSNMKTISAIYQKVRHRLNDDWAFGNDVDARPWDFQAEECSLRAAVDRFNNRHYVPESLEITTEDDEFKPVNNDTLSVLGKKVELGDEFKNNYERWLEREVFTVDIDWDQLCTCKKS